MSSHRTQATTALEEIGEVYERDPVRCGEAAGHGILALADEVAGLRREQQIANVLTILREHKPNWPTDDKLYVILVGYINELTNTTNGDPQQ